jgi:hypothetical protein
MTRPSRIAKRLALPVLLAGTLAVVQAVVASPPNASFNVSGQQAGGCGTFTFTDTSIDAENDIQAIQWDLDDGATVPGTVGGSVTHTYESAMPAVRSVTLTATDANTDPDGEAGELPGDGIEDATASQTVTIVNAAPTASFTGPTNVALGQAITVQGAGADADGIQSFAWDLTNDNGFTEAQGQTLALNYATPAATPGLKSVALQVTDNCDVPSSNPNRVFFNVTNPPPTASFTVGSSSGASSLQAGENVTITSTSTDQTGGSISGYQWDLNNNGDYNEGGATGEENTASVVTAFPPGTATIRLIVTDNHGAPDEEVRTVPVSALPLPKSGFTFSPVNPLPGEAITLRSTSTISTAAGAPALARIEWDFDYSPTGDFTPDATGEIATTSFATAGPKSVAVRAVDTAGGFTTAPTTIVVNAPPVAVFTVAPSKPVEGRAVTFASSSSDDDGPISKHEWDLDNDGSYDDGSGVLATTAKLKKGARIVRLRVTDAKGATSATARAVNVRAKPLKPPVDVKRSIGFARRKWGIELVTLIVKVPSKTTVKVSCKGRGCPRGALKRRSKKKAATLRFDGLRGSVRAGAKIVVLTSRPGHISAYDTYIVRGDYRGPVLRERCRRPGARAAQRCP